MKNVVPSTRTSKRPRGEAFTTAPTSGDMPVAEEIYVDPTAAVDPSGDDNAFDPTFTPPFSLRATSSTL